jgi:glycosyltransferase involved in cell wall biosynthesis
MHHGLGSPTSARDALRPIVSVLVPARDEADVLPHFLLACSLDLPELGVPFEVVVVDDGSVDGTHRVLTDAMAVYPWLRLERHAVGAGIAAALVTAGRVARGSVAVFYPADLQYHPRDVARLVAPILAGSADLVTGTRQGAYDRALVSRVYNQLCRWLFAVPAADLNGVKAYRVELMRGIPLRRDWHRFMVVLAAARGARITSVDIPLSARQWGRSKFTWRRIPVGFFDLLAVWFQLRAAAKPMLFFGFPAALMLGVGGAGGALALWLRLVGRADVVLLVSLVQVLLLGGLLLFGFGFLGELLVAASDSGATHTSRVPPCGADPDPVADDLARETAALLTAAGISAGDTPVA